MPIFFALALMIGVLIGTQLNMGPGSFAGNSGKLDKLLQIIQKEYVDPIDTDSLSELAITALLSELDPHSTYIPPADLQSVNEDMEGNFEGVGIEFNVTEDTISVVAVVSGGPSEKAGILPGDRIVKIDGETVAGVKISNEQVIKKLRGQKGSEVKVSVNRRGSKGLVDFEIIRDRIPLYSVDAAFILRKNIGYIKISRFAATTFDEYQKAIQGLQKEGIQKLVLDLRGNPGGYLDQAIDLADEFLKDNELIVYTEGHNRKKQQYYATSAGDWEDQPLVVLIDESSASASEIVAGALQDQDRATIIGRRSFGKGLVQEQMEFKDGSAMRLTVARYYTPSGRSIQRQYSKGTAAYYEEMLQRMEHYGDEDSTQKIGDTVKYYTKNKRVVYGGGGVHPDIVVKADSADFQPGLIALFNTGAINRFAFEFSDENRETLKKTFPTYQSFAGSTQATQRIRTEFDSFLKKSPETSGIKLSDAAVLRAKAIVGRNIWGNAAYFYIIALDDKAIHAAENKLDGI